MKERLNRLTFILHLSAFILVLRSAFIVYNGGMEDLEIKELEKSLERIWEVARGFGLDPYPVRFEVVPATVMYEIGSYALPGRYSHWTFGKAYHRMTTMYALRPSNISEG